MQFVPKLTERAQAALHEGQFGKAIELYHLCLEKEPNEIALYWNLGLALLLSGEVEEAQGVWTHAMLVSAVDSESESGLESFLSAAAERYQKEERRSHAKKIYEQLIELNSDNFLAYYQLGVLLQQEPDSEAPLQPIQYFLRALELAPGFAPAWFQLARIYEAAGQLSETLSACQTLSRLNPRDFKSLSAAGFILHHMGDIDRALEYYQRAIAINPLSEIEIQNALLLPSIFGSKTELEKFRQRLEQKLSQLSAKNLSLSEPHREVNLTLFKLAYQGKNDREIQVNLAQLYERACPDLLFVAPHCKDPSSLRLDPIGKIRIGFFSARFFRRHTIGRLNCGLIANLSRELFEVIVFSLPVSQDDPVAQFIRSHSDKYVTVTDDLSSIRGAIAQEELDILFYPSIGMDSLNYFLAFSRLAPIQIMTWGHPVTTGISNIDYFLSSRHLEPEGSEEHYSEKLLCPERIAVYYYRPEIPPRKPKIAFNFEEGHHHYVCPQSLFKLHPDFDLILRDILLRDPVGRVVLIESLWLTETRKILQRFERFIPEVIDRIKILPRLSSDDFLRLLGYADVAIDPIHFGGGKTTYEAFSMGVPVITMEGDYMRSRITYALYRQMGFTDCIATSVEDYVTKAVRLGTNASERQRVSEAILARGDAIYEDREAVRELEQCLVRLHQERCGSQS